MNTTTIPEESGDFTSTTSSLSSGSSNALLITGIIILSFVSIFGTIGNGIVIYTIWKERKLRIPGNFFIINLTVANIIITGFSIPVIVANLSGELGVGNIDAYNLHVQNSGFCEASAYLKTIALHVAWYSLAFIALNRYYTVCRMNEYINHFTKKHVLITIALTWIWVLLINIPIMVGWAIPSDKILSENSTEGYYAFYEVGRPPVLYDSSSHDCVLGVNNMGGYTYANGFFVLCIPLVAITFCYSLVYMAIVESRRKMKASIDVKQLKRRYKKERKISIMLSTIVIVFILCWAPAIVYDYISDLNFNTGINYVRLTFNWLALSNSAMNSILFAAMSKAFRTGYKRILVMILFRLVCGCCGCGRRMKKSLKNINLSSGSRSSSTRTPAKSRNTSVLMEFKRIMRKSGDGSQFFNKASETPRKNSNFLEVPRENHPRKNRPRKENRSDNSNQYVCEVAGISNNEYFNKNSTIAEEANAEDNNTSTNGDLVLPVPSSGTAKKTFTPLLEKINRDQDVFSEGGIYLGMNGKHRVKRSLKNKRKGSKKSETWVNPVALEINNCIRSDVDLEINEETLSPDRDNNVGGAL